MKVLLSLLFLFPIFASSQDCKIKRSEDKFTKEIRVSTSFLQFGQGLDTYKISVDATKAEIELNIVVKGGKEGNCFDDQTNVSAMWAEAKKSKTNYNNAGSMNCKGMLTLRFKNGPSLPSNLKYLLQRKVKSFLVAKPNVKEPMELVMTDEEAARLQVAVGCLLAEAQALRAK